MKVAEVRTKLKSFPQEDLPELFVSAYKMVPKEKKEDLDDLLLNGLSAKRSNDKAKVTARSEIDFDSLRDEIETFLKNAYAQNYFAPNRVIPKAQRSKWRFHVRSFWKTLTSIGEDSPHFSEANELLGRLFEMLSYACGYYLFRTDDPFQSIQMEQADLYETVAARFLKEDRSTEMLERIVLLALNSDLSRITLHTFFYCRLIPILETYGLLENTCEVLMKLYDRGGMSPRTVEEAGELMLRLRIQMGKTELGISAYWAMLNSVQKDREVSLYVLLYILAQCEEKEIWIQTYEKALKDGIEPREKLQLEYAERTEEV